MTHTHLSHHPKFATAPSSCWKGNGPLRTCTRTGTRHKWFHVSPANGQCHLTFGLHMYCFCVHVSHPCTHFILQWAPTISPPPAELIHGYKKLGQHIIWPWCARRTHTRTRGIVQRALPVSSAKQQSSSGRVLSWMTW
ncbi:hypothetical protein O181_076398 [Austropuccinia psidii MF-1]|uniref:Uncharacterized protein n=1 Tax=Austropuccinia psidii MF-1 TaxID=1389203 RepID=A0A9Q3FEW5_9BASI|nr:hypothetical protein [Austropuccinia psidii MF-1]